MIFTHNRILFIFPTIHTKWPKSRTHIKQGTFWSLHGHEPFFFCSIHQQITVTPKHITKPEDISLVIKTKPQHSPGLPEMSELSENNPENSTRTIRKQSRKFSSDCPKIVSKIPKNLYIEIYGLSRPQRKPQAIK